MVLTFLSETRDNGRKKKDNDSFGEEGKEGKRRKGERAEQSEISVSISYTSAASTFQGDTKTPFATEFERELSESTLK